VLVMSRFVVAEADEAAFLDRARTALRALASRPGYRGGRIGRAADEPTAWVVTSEWDGIGAYRRALSSYDAKVHAHPLLGEAIAEPGAYEVLYADDGDGVVAEAVSARADDADRGGPGEGAGNRRG
jgi:heme oxygenase (mycobilin-producing)